MLPSIFIVYLFNFCYIIDETRARSKSCGECYGQGSTEINANILCVKDLRYAPCEDYCIEVTVNTTDIYSNTSDHSYTMKHKCTSSTCSTINITEEFGEDYKVIKCIDNEDDHIDEENGEISAKTTQVAKPTENYKVFPGCQTCKGDSGSPENAGANCDKNKHTVPCPLNCLRLTVETAEGDRGKYAVMVQCLSVSCTQIPKNPEEGGTIIKCDHYGNSDDYWDEDRQNQWEEDSKEIRKMDAAICLSPSLYCVALIYFVLFLVV